MENEAQPKSKEGVYERIKAWFRRHDQAASDISDLPPLELSKDGLLRILSFSAGEFDGVMYLGLIHALLFSKRKPDIIAGISSGAIAAVMAAEIFQANGNQAPSSAQIARFRELLGLTQNLPNHLMRDLLPRLLELGAPAPLEPLRSPVLAEEERAERLRAVQSRHGLLLLYNGLLGSRLKVSTLTRLVRRALDFRYVNAWQAKWIWRMLDWPEQRRPEYRSWKAGLGKAADWSGRLVLRVWILTHLWFDLLWPMLLEAPRVFRALWAIGLGWHIAEMRQEEQNSNGQRSLTNRIRKTLFIRREPRSAKGLLFRRFENIAVFFLKPFEYAVGLLTWCTLNPLTLTTELVCLGYLLLYAAQNLGVVVWFITAVFALGLIVVTAGAWRDPLASFLGYFDLKSDLATSYVARLLYVTAFDPAYFGEPALPDMLSAALRGDDSAKATAKANRKLLRDYLYKKKNGAFEPREHPILVMPVAANVGSGRIEAADPRESVVDALCAATALVPLFRAQPLKFGGEPKWNGAAWFIDGANVAQEPHLPILDTLKRLTSGKWSLPGISLGDVKRIEILAVSPDPVDQALCREREQQWNDSFGSGAAAQSEDSNMVDHERLLKSIPTVFGLQRVQRAKDERLLVQVYGNALTSFKTPVVKIPGTDQLPEQTYIAAQVCAIEPKQPLEVAAQLLQAESAEQTRAIIGKTIADGCRVTLQRLYETELEQYLAGQPNSPGEVSCAEFISKILCQSFLPGSRSEVGPGLAEVCSCCTRKLLRPPLKQRVTAPSTGEPTAEQPMETNRTPEKPLVSVVFAGGVFRGVFQVGVINALNQAGLQPDIVAGASVGTIMSAMAATTLGQRNGWTRAKREERVRSVAATFLAIDRLILTDRFADFVRQLTLRLGKADFSPRDMDTTFRQFDRRNWGNYSKSVRQVLAGLEQIFFVDGKELLDMAICARERDHKRLVDLLRDCGQEFLDQSGIGFEMLGSEPLELLIRHHVLHPMGLELHGSSQFDVFRQFGIEFLATVTNLTTKQLDLLSSLSPPDRQPELLEGLLASSAFPAVFRPRWSWEIRAVSPWQLCVDGGVLDNLPLVPTARFMFYLIRKGLAKVAPSLPGRAWSPSTATPHLLFTASLEVTPRSLSSPEEQSTLGKTVNSWMELHKRAGRLRHNRKVDRFIQFLEDIRRIRTASGDSNFAIPDMHAICVKPQWLCGTFAFHPMLGFQKIEQARSIAHGCASTFAQLYLEERRFGERARAWWGKLEVNANTIIPQKSEGLPPLLKPAPARQLHKPGNCWFRNSVPCPFSPQQLELAASNGEALPAPVFRDLTTIYLECGKAKTHARRQ